MATWYSQGSGLWSTLSNWNDAADGSGSAPASIAAFDDSRSLSRKATLSSSTLRTR